MQLRIRGAAATAAALILILALSCGGDDGGVEVVATDSRFEPRRVTVAVGDPVRFVNEDSEVHTFTADDGTFDSGVVPSGEPFVHVFRAQGELPFHCEIHPAMTGVVVVR